MNGLPWKSRLPKKFTKHPVSLIALQDWPDLKKADYVHIEYLMRCSFLTERYRLSCWEDVLAIGPFINRSRVFSTIPFVIITYYRKPYRHILTISKAFAEVYLEFGILPTIFLLRPDEVSSLEKKEDRDWLMTRQVSIPLFL